MYHRKASPDGLRRTAAPPLETAHTSSSYCITQTPLDCSLITRLIRSLGHSATGSVWGSDVQASRKYTCMNQSKHPSSQHIAHMIRQLCPKGHCQYVQSVTGSLLATDISIVMQHRQQCKPSLHGKTDLLATTRNSSIPYMHLVLFGAVSLVGEGSDSSFDCHGNGQSCYKSKV